MLNSLCGSVDFCDSVVWSDSPRPKGRGFSLASELRFIPALKCGASDASDEIDPRPSEDAEEMIEVAVGIRLINLRESPSRS